MRFSPQFTKVVEFETLEFTGESEREKWSGETAASGKRQERNRFFAAIISHKSLS